MAIHHRLVPGQGQPPPHRDPLARFRVERFPTTAAHVGNPARYAEAIAAARRLHLDEQDPHIRLLLAQVDLDDASGPMQHLLHDLITRIEPYVAFHRDHPFATAPRHVLNGPIIIGEQVNDARPIGLTPTDVMQHGLIIGPSGSGKTTVLLQIVQWLLTLRLLLGIIDIKDDFGWLFRRPDVLLIDETTRWNPLAVPPFLNARAHALEVRDEINTRFFGGQWQAQILDDALLRLYERTLTPCLQDLVDEIGRGAYPREAPLYAEARRSTITRLKRFSDEALYTTRDDGISWQTIIDSSFVIRARSYDDVARFKYDLLTRYTYLAHRAAHITIPRRVFVFDEGNDLLTSNQDGIKAIEPLHRTKQMSREWGIGFLGTGVTLDRLADLATTSTNFLIALRPNNGTEARSIIRALGLNTQQMTAYLHRMTIGDALLRTAAWPEVVHLKIAPNTQPKYASADDIRAAREGTNRRARQPLLLPAITIDTPASSLSPNASATAEPQPTAAAPSVTPSLVLEPPIAPNSAFLTVAQRHFLTINCELGIALVIEMYERCDLKPMQGDRIKKALSALGLITATRITVGATRGKQATALTPTEIAYNTLGLKRPRLGRGSGPQHAWLLRTLHERIPGSVIEVNGADLGIAYNSDVHARLLAALDRQDLSLNNGESVAIEVELDPVRTATPNLNRDRNYTLVIIAVQKEQIAAATRIAKEYQNAIVVDVFALLDALERP